METETSRRARNRLSGSAMSYKFQRLRERIRQSVANGELSGKLPGERELARRFQVNAKTLSKALTDLAAEGLLQRSIGRGTFVRNANGELPETVGPWLLLLDSDSDPALVDHIKAINPQAEICLDVSSIRPSGLSQFRAVVDLAAATPEPFVRNLVVRSIPVVAVGHELRTYSVNGVLLDSTLGAAQLTRQLILGGHRQFLAVEERARITIADAIRRTAARYCDDYSVDACAAADVAQAVDHARPPVYAIPSTGRPEFWKRWIAPASPCRGKCPLPPSDGPDRITPAPAISSIRRGRPRPSPKSSTTVNPAVRPPFG